MGFDFLNEKLCDMLIHFPTTSLNGVFCITVQPSEIYLVSGNHETNPILLGYAFAQLISHFDNFLMFNINVTHINVCCVAILVTFRVDVL